MKLFILLSLLISNSYAGDSKGHGGDILVCNNNNQAHHMALDHYELIEKFNWDFEITNQTAFNMAQSALIDLYSYDFFRADRLLNKLDTFYQDVKWVNFPLSDIRDSGEVSIPSDCKLEQIINQNKDLLRGHKKYIIRKDLWNKLSAKDQAMLMVHELLYLETTTATSEGVRELNARLFSSMLKNFTKQEYRLFLFENKFQTFTYGNIEIKFKGINTSDNFETIHKALPANNATITLYNQKLRLADFPIKFYNNKKIYHFCALDPLYIDFMEKKLPIECVRTFGEYVPTRLNREGKILKGAVHTLKLETKGYTFYFGDLMRSYSFYSELMFDQDGDVFRFDKTALTANGISFKGTEPIISWNQTFRGVLDKAYLQRFSGNEVSINSYAELKNGSIVKADVSIDTQVIIGKNKIHLKSGDKIIMYETGEFFEITLSTDHDLIINGKFKKYKTGDKVIFYRDGRIRW